MGKSTISMVIFNSYVKLPEDNSQKWGMPIGCQFHQMSWSSNEIYIQNHPNIRCCNGKSPYQLSISNPNWTSNHLFGKCAGWQWGTPDIQKWTSNFLASVSARAKKLRCEVCPKTPPHRQNWQNLPMFAWVCLRCHWDKLWKMFWQQMAHLWHQ